LTALDDVNEATLGTRPTLSHATARLEVANLINAIAIVPEQALPAADAAAA
jgi:chromosome partitioning protein